MAWTAPRTWVVGELVTAAIMNTYIRDNQAYLNTWVQNNVTGVRDIASTVFRNTDEKPIFVSVSCNCRVNDDGAGGAAGHSVVRFHVGPLTPPGPLVTVAHIGITLSEAAGWAVADHHIGLYQAFFMVLPLYYYQAITSIAGSGANPTLVNWYEWNDA